MLAKACSCAVIGLDGALVEVEVDIGHGLPAFSIVGLPDAAVTEAKERVRAAIKNSGAIFPCAASPSTWPRRSAQGWPRLRSADCHRHPDGLGAGALRQRGGDD